MEYTKEQILQILNNPKERSKLDAQLDLTKYHKLHVNGDGFKEWWLKRIDKIESKNNFEIKKLLAREATPRIYEAVKKQYHKIFRAGGFVFDYNIKEENSLTKFKEQINKCYYGKSLMHFMQTKWFDAMFEEFNGLVGIELKTKEEKENDNYDGIPFYLVLKPLNEIYDLQYENDEFSYVIFCVKLEKDGKQIDAYRWIDKKQDTIFIKENNTFVVNTYINERGVLVEDSIVNQFGFIPFHFISEYKKSVNCDIKRISPITKTISNANLYQSVHDDHVVNCKLHNNPIFYSYPVTCPTCNGKGVVKTYDEERNYTGDSECGTCHGRRQVAHWVGDITAGITLPIGEDFERTGFPAAAPPAGYVQRDVESMKQQIEILDIQEKAIEKGCLGVEGILNRESRRVETATSRELDMQPLMDALNRFSDNAQIVHTFLLNTIAKIIMPKGGYDIFVYYGRKYFLRSEEQITAEMEQAKKAGMNTVYLDELNDEITQVKFSHNDKSKYRAIILNEVQPLLHYNTKDELELANQFTDRDTMIVKVNFKDLIEQFEEENGNIELFALNKSFKDKCKLIKQKLYEYAKQRNVAQIGASGQ